MLSTPSLGGRLFVELLEQRIAPTNLVAFANHPVDAGLSNYLTYTTPPSAGKLGFVSASTYGVAGPSNLFAIALTGNGTSTTAPNGLPVSTGDQLQIFTPDGYKIFLQAEKGQLVAFFLDSNNDNQVQNDELVGLAIGKKSIVDVGGNVNGDIVTNLGPTGSLMLSTAGSAKQKILGLNITGNVFGNIFSGGDIDNLNVTGNVNAIYAGTAGNGLVYNFGGPGQITGAIQQTAPADTVTGASINNGSVVSITDRIQAGDGGFLAAGGSISGLTVQGDATGLKLYAGNGGGGGVGTTGGTGGSIVNLLVKGTADTTPNNTILIQAGHGGDNLAGKGGAGGDVSGIATSYDSYDPSTGTGQVSANFLADNIVVHAGAGGAGTKGGHGGSVSNSLLFGSIPDDGITNADGTHNAEIQVFGGNGGANITTSNGKSGVGGSVSTVTAENLDADLSGANSSILLQGGAGGAVTAGGKGKAGGDVAGVSLLGTQVFLVGGDGAAGAEAAGNGGNISDVSVLNLQNLFTNVLSLNAGTGAVASDGNGGAGGSISQVQMGDSDLAALVIDSGVHGNGGAGSAGKGGEGGSVSNLSLNDSGTFREVPATVAARSGSGGDGLFGGGAAGDFNTVQLVGSDFIFNFTAGNGGNVLPTGIGKGGAGGNVLTLGVSNQPFDADNPQYSVGATGTVIGGAGGSGFSKGGKGGDLNLVNLRAAYDVTMTGGAGGNGNLRAAGAGGSISGAGDSLLGAVTARAGNAGMTGASAGAGGGISQFVAAAATNIAITSGAGGAGGAGGDISNSGTSFNELTGAANTGSLTVAAGGGSAANGVGGGGGSILTFNGSLGLSGTTSFVAGVGGGGSGASASGAGGSIDSVKLTGPGGEGASPVTVYFDAGDAGTATAAKNGAAGGSVTNITLSGLATGTTVHHLAAGDGSSGIKHGGAGGSIDQVHVGVAGEATADIGIRSGAAYGYNLNGGAGGLFAGIGGNGRKSGGVPGDVTNITANAISSIVAGKGAPQLANNVDDIYLNGLTATKVDPNNASFVNFGVANLVGSVLQPTAANASTYKSGDGLIAAHTLGNDRNFRFEALLTLDDSGNLVLADYQQPNPTLVITPYS